MIAHLLESTLLLAMAILVAHMPRLAARTRYAVVFAALMKFAIPSAMVPRILALAGIDLAQLPKGTILIQALGPLTATKMPATTAVVWPVVFVALWLGIAVALLARAVICGRTVVRLALLDAFDASPRELAALAQARARAGVKRIVHLVRSSWITTPATVGFLRTVIVMPASTNLGDAELETILTHECAHIARHDNLLGVVESIAGCALWFHPLVWIARRVLDAAREEACDAIVIASGDTNAYVTALGKVCGAVIAPRAAGISCIVSNTISERMDAIMRFKTRRLLPHRVFTTTVIALMAAATIGIGVARALPAGEDVTSSDYNVHVTATRQASPDFFIFDVSVLDRKSGQVVASARMRAIPETWATMENKSDHATYIRMIGHIDGAAEVEVTVDHEPPIITKLIAKRVDAPKKPKGDTISIDLKDADIRDVLKTFSQLSNTEIIVDDDVTGHTTIQMHEIEWTKALSVVLHQNSLRLERIGNTIYIHRN